VIAVPPGVRILLAARPVDFRKGMDGLAALVQRNRRGEITALRS
jgi:hypothetical protein